MGQVDVLGVAVFLLHVEEGEGRLAEARRHGAFAYSSATCAFAASAEVQTAMGVLQALPLPLSRSLHPPELKRRQARVQKRCKLRLLLLGSLSRIVFLVPSVALPLSRLGPEALVD